MARLNESGNAPAATSAAQRINPSGPPTIETLEAVKRNLIRQNRNLARANSTQSLQIRTLGAEVSRLLAYNIEMKEENISLREQLREAQGGSRLAGLRMIRKAMSDSLKEMTMLLEGQTGNAHDEPQPSPETRKSMCLESMEFRDRPSLRTLMEPHRMPTIREHRVFPRPPAQPLETLPDERESDRASVGSYEVEPIAVARDITSVPASPTEQAVTTQPTQDERSSEDARLTTPDANNVETRRRRKLSSSGVSARRQSDLMLRFSDKESTLLKSGAKRKHADAHSDFEDPRLIKSATRDIAISPGKSSAVKRLNENEDNAPSKDVVPILQKPARKVLGEKSTNISPKKLKVHDGKDKEKQQAGRPRRTSHLLPAKKIGDSREAADQVAEEEVRAAIDADTTVEIVVPPITPLPADLFSPVSSERSFVGVGKIDTPPPLDLSITTTTSAHEEARPSRRARAAVNYAEPSLVAKMRRPSKAMVDALSGLQDPRRAMHGSSGRRGSSVADPDTLLTESAPESEISVDDKALDIGDSTHAAELQTSLPHPHARQQAESRPLAARQEEPTRSSSSKLSSLMASGRSRHLPSAGDDEVVDLAVFDLDDSSSTDSPAADRVEERRPAQKSGRRHSSAIKTNSMKASDGSRQDPVRSSSSTSRRRSMMV